MYHVVNPLRSLRLDDFQQVLNELPPTQRLVSYAAEFNRSVMQDLVTSYVVYEESR